MGQQSLAGKRREHGQHRALSVQALAKASQAAASGQPASCESICSMNLSTRYSGGFGFELRRNEIVGLIELRMASRNYLSV
jgi:hypothetical protein